MADIYSEQSKIELHKYLTDLSVKLIKEGYWETDDQGITRKMKLTIDNIAKLQRELQHKMIYHVFGF